MKKLYIDSKTFCNATANYLLLLLLCIFFGVFKEALSLQDDNWLGILGWSSLALLVMNIITLHNSGYKILSFQIVFILFLYTFMLGRVILAGVLGVNQIFSEGYMRTVISLNKVSQREFIDTVLFILCCIQAIVCGFIAKDNVGLEKVQEITTKNRKLFQTGIIILLVGIPCHLINSIRMIISAQLSSSYNAIVEFSGLIDDFANFIVPGLFCILFSNVLKKKTILSLYIGVTLYLIMVMILTGDRRYQAITIVVLLLAYIVKNDIRFSWRHIIVVVAGVFMLNLFVEIREIRNQGLLSISSFLSEHWESIFTLKSGFLSQSLYEFGVSIYSVAYTIQAIPVTSGFRLGATFLRGILMIIPVGFLYQNWEIVKFGGIASAVERFSGSAIGGAMIGDLYGNFGYAGGIICALLVGIIIRKMISFRNEKNIDIESVKYFTLFYTLIHLARASFSEVIRTTVWCIGIVYLVYWAIGGNKNANESAN